MAQNLPAIFEANNLPAHLRGAVVDNALASHYTPGFKVLSLKGSRWAVVSGEERTVLMNPLDPKSPASYIDLVIIKASPVKNKVWYAGSYVEGAEVGKPDCFSVDGVKPDAQSEKPQAKSCAACPKNQWGSKISTDGKASKGKACNDSIRMAVAQASQLDEPYLLRIPPASIKAAGEFGAILAKRGIPLEAVVTRLAFDPDSPTPKVTFAPQGFLNEVEFAAARESSQSDTVEAILGVAGLIAPEGVAESSVLDEVPAHVAAAGPTAEELEEKAEAEALAAIAAKKAKRVADAAAAAEALRKHNEAKAAEAAKVTKTPEQLEEEEEERQLAELAAKKAARLAKTAESVITSDKEVKDVEIAAAVASAEAGLGVVTSKPASTRKPKAANAAPAASEADGGDTVVIVEIPDLSSINFDD